jgi:hypothetical protein
MQAERRWVAPGSVAWPVPCGRRAGCFGACRDRCRPDPMLGSDGRRGSLLTHWACHMLRAHCSEVSRCIPELQRLDVDGSQATRIALVLFDVVAYALPDV